MSIPISNGPGTERGESPARDRAGTVAARIDRVPIGRFHGKLVSIVGLGTFFDGFDAISLAVVLPAVVAVLQISFVQAGLIISAGFLGQFVGAILIGALADRYGRRRAFICCLVSFGATAILCAVAWSFTSLLLFRMVQGIGLGAEVPIAATLINEYLARQNRGRISVIYESLFTWGIFFAPVIALLLTSALGPEAGWRALLGCGAVPLLIAVWAWFALPESARWLADRGKIEEADRYVTLMERQARERGHVLEAPTATLEEKPRRAKRRELLQRQYGARTILLAVLWFATFFVTYGFTVWLPTLYVSVGGLPQTRSLLLTVVLGALQVAMAYVVASVIDRLGRRATFMIGFAIALIGGTFGFLTILLYHNPRWDVLFATGVILTIGIMPPTVSLYLYTNELYPTRLRGFATSSASSLSRIASIISPLIFGAMLDGHGGAGAIFAVLAVTALLGFLAIWLRGIETRGRSLEEIAT